MNIKAITYSPDDIKELIINDLTKKGYILNNLRFNVSSTFVTDAYGLNGVTLNNFLGAEIYISEKEKE